MDTDYYIYDKIHDYNYVTLKYLLWTTNNPSDFKILEITLPLTNNGGIIKYINGMIYAHNCWNL